MRASLMTAVFLVGCRPVDDTGTPAEPDPDPTEEPVCGDAVCNADEGYLSCPSDCDEPLGGLGSWTMEGCAEGATQSELEESTRILLDSESSLHEMVACGTLQWQLVGSVVQTALALVGLSDTPDTGFVYQGDGTGSYTTSAGGSGSSMEVVFRLGEDYEVGAAGEVVPADLFDPDSYLTGVTVSADLHQAEVSYASTGPLVELLGFGVSPPNPLVIDLADLESAFSELETVRVASTIYVSDAVDETTVVYAAESVEKAVAHYALGDTLDLDALEVDATRGSQGFVGTDSELVYSNGLGALDGFIDAEVRDGPVDYDVRLVYDSSGWPTWELSCP